MLASGPSTGTRKLRGPWVTRFAPSPTGYLHLGHCLSAIFVWGVARALGAKVILRIEDHDTSRCRKHFDEAILTDLQWLGFEADLGVANVQHPSAYRQSERIMRYDEVLNTLINRKRCYACECSRKQVEQQMAQPSDELFYTGVCKHKDLPLGQQVGIRFLNWDGAIVFQDLWLGEQTQNPYQQCGDFLLKDRNHQYTYQFCVSVDDIDHGVNFVIRGQDLTSSTSRQIHLKREIGWDGANTLYLHHPLLKDPTGKKLSKRFAAESIATHRNDRTDSCSVLRWACQASQVPGLETARDRQEISAFFQKLVQGFQF